MIEGHSFTCTATKVWLPLTASCSLTPQTDTNQVGAEHGLTITVIANGSPASGVAVDFLVAAGPNAGESGMRTTGGSGQTTFAYLGDGGAGTDTILATGIVNGVSFSCSASKVWVLGPCPDLSGLWSKVKSKCKMKNDVETCKLSGRLEIPNSGTEAAGESVARYYLFNDDTFDDGDTMLAPGEVKAIKVDKSGKAKLKAELVNNDPTGRFLIAVVDATGLVSECSEANNVAVFGPIP